MTSERKPQRGMCWSQPRRLPSTDEESAKIKAGGRRRKKRRTFFCRSKPVGFHFEVLTQAQEPIYPFFSGIKPRNTFFNLKIFFLIFHLRCMDRLLAMSILSAGPGFSGAEGWVLSRFASGRMEKREKKEREGGGKEAPTSLQRKKREPRFAVEFDGLHCFETIVSD